MRFRLVTLGMVCLILLIEKSLAQQTFTVLDLTETKNVLAGAKQVYPKFSKVLDSVRLTDPLIKQVLLVRGVLKGSPATAAPNGIIRIDSKFLQRQIPNFDDDRLIVVILHEIGHLHYYQRTPPGKRNPEESEKAAFEYSLLKTKEMALNGDCLPLKAGIKFMFLRSQSNDLTDAHVRALKRIVTEPAYQAYKQFAEKACK